MLQPTDRSGPSTSITPIVCLGASAGGLRALESFFRMMPTKTGCSFVVVQHLSPDFRSLMDDLLGRQTSMAIHPVEDGMKLEPDSIYLIPPRKLMTVQNECLHLTERVTDRQHDLPINVFLSSLAEEVGPRAIAVILSGTGTDGTEGAQAVRKAGGLVIVQDPETAEFDGMPRSVLMNNGLADYILPTEKIPEAIVAYAQDPKARIQFEPRTSENTNPDGTEIDPKFASIFKLLRQSCGIDFSYYKIATVERRIHRRMALLGITDFLQYAERLSQEPSELDALYQDLLIGVTEFFRDPDAFDAMKRLFYRNLLSHSDQNEIRVWIAGCATGEEAYSHAILLDEIADEVGYKGRICIFATDAHRTSLETASAGVYREERLANLSPKRLARYFREEKPGYFRVSVDIRKLIVFAPHNLLSDPPFTKLDAISCRNLLIYLTPETQSRVISIFHYSLKPECVLMMGMSEGLGSLADHFEVVDSKQKIFRKTKTSRLPQELRTVGITRPSRNIVHPVASITPLSSSLPRGLIQAYDYLLNSYVPSGFIIAEDGTILHYIGDAARYLTPLSGRSAENILQRTDGNLRLTLSTLIPKVIRDRVPGQSLGLSVEGGSGSPELIDLRVQTLPEDRSGVKLLHISIRNPRKPASLKTDEAFDDSIDSETLTTQQAHSRRIIDLEVELLSTRENLQATVEELQTTNEELQAANEEMLAANEELQSTNEELHSVNEELYTVNAEFESKNFDLNRLNADLDNLLKATDTGTLFLDRDLRIRIFNPAIERIFRLLPQDVGRPIEHIAYHLDDQAGMIEEACAVLADGTPREGEVRTRDGHWLLKRIFPFLNTRHTIEGVVLTFTRIDLIKKMQKKLDLAMTASRLVWWEWDTKSGELQTHTGGECILGYNLAQVCPKANTWLELTHPDDLPQVQSSLDACITGKTDVWECEHRLKAASGEWRWVHNKGNVSERDHNHRALRMIGTTQDVHSRHIAETEATKLGHILKSAELSILITDPSGKIEYANPCYLQNTGYTEAEVIGQSPRIFQSVETDSATFKELWTTISSGQTWRGDLKDRRKDGTACWQRLSVSPIKDAHDRIINYIALLEDITEMKADQERRNYLEFQLAQSQKMETLGTLAGGIAHDFNNLLTSILGYAHIARTELPKEHSANDSLLQIERAGNRAANLVRRILAFSRSHTLLTHQPVSLGLIYEETLPMLRACIPSSIELAFKDESAGSLTFGDGTQLQQVLLNLCTNAAHSIGTSPGRIDIGLSNVEMTGQEQVQVGELNKGPYIRLILTDTGTGITPDVLKRMFDPFFTTKPPGEGTGLGLTILQNTVTTHHGAIQVISEPNVGTTFTLYFPKFISTQAPSSPTVTPTTASSRLGRGNGQRIMIIDDENSILDLARMALNQFGYQPIVFNQASDCLEVLRADPKSADLIITDQTMPGMTGIDLINILRQEGCTTPIIIASGYSTAVTPEIIAQLDRVSFLPKPFTIESLYEKVRQQLPN